MRKIRIKAERETGIYTVQERKSFLFFFHYWSEVDYFFGPSDAQDLVIALQETGRYEFIGWF